MFLDARPQRWSISPKTQLVGWDLDCSGLYSQGGPLDQHREQLIGPEGRMAQLFRVATVADRFVKAYEGETRIR